MDTQGACLTADIQDAALRAVMRTLSAKLHKVSVYETIILTPVVLIVDIHRHAGHSSREIARFRRLS